jgi:hypothetical protein
MKKSIYDVYVTVTSQKQADRLKGICLEYGLPIWLAEVAFKFNKLQCCFSTHGGEDFFIGSQIPKWMELTQITESEFEQLAKEFKQ